jgi:ABC-2 type transport system permease protein
MTDTAIRSGGLRAPRSLPAAADLRLLLKQVRYEQISYWRNPAAAFFTFAFPLVFFFILTGIAGGQGDKQHLGAGVHLAQYYTPSILAYAIMSASFLSLTMSIVNKREEGILKRYRGTPLPTWVLLGGFIGSALIVSLLMSAVVIGAGVVLFGVHLAASDLGPIAGIVVLSTLAFCALGLAVSSLIPNLDSGPAIINLPFFILVFISGTYFPVGGTLKDIAGYFPLRPLMDGMLRYFDPFMPELQTYGHDAWLLLVWGAAAVVFAVRRFRWVPRR